MIKALKDGTKEELLAHHIKCVDYFNTELKVYKDTVSKLNKIIKEEQSANRALRKVKIIEVPDEKVLAENIRLKKRIANIIIEIKDYAESLSEHDV